MAGGWVHTNRRPLPRDWDARRRVVRERANGICEVTGCTQPGTECDHAVHRDDHRIESLMWLCEEHHQQKTLAEAQATRRAIHAKARHPNSR